MSAQQIVMQMFQDLNLRSMHALGAMTDYHELRISNREEIIKFQHNNEIVELLIKKEERYETAIRDLSAQLKEICSSFDSLPGNFGDLGFGFLSRATSRMVEEERVEVARLNAALCSESNRCERCSEGN